MQSIWIIVVVVGPILFLAAIAYMTVRNKLKSTPQSEALTERATRSQREAQAAEPKEVDGPLG
jgi:flagellar basal body-associated protein FliL